MKTCQVKKRKPDRSVHARYPTLRSLKSPRSLLLSILVTLSLPAAQSGRRSRRAITPSLHLTFPSSNPQITILPH
ncbi:MAG: hypothetical protein K0B15_09945 [Lentimicrobium sp.]|nr:hypothetical protein [Lentimicrobium sp.]